MIRTSRFALGLLLVGMTLPAASPLRAQQAPDKKDQPTATGTVEQATKSAGEAADKAAQSASSSADKAAQSASSTTDKAAQSASNTADKAADQAGQAADRATKAAGSAADNAANQAGKAADRAADQAGKATDRTANQAGQAADRASGALNNAAGQAGQAADRATNQASQAADRATSAAGNAADQARDAAGHAAGQAGQAADRASGALNNAAGQAAGAVNNSADRAGQAVNNAANQAGQTINQARNAAGQAINQAGINPSANVAGRAALNTAAAANLAAPTAVQTQAFSRVFSSLGLGWTPGANALTLATLAPNGPFAQAGLMPGDQLVSIGGQPIATQADFVRYLYGMPVGQQIPLVVMRNGAQQTLYWTPGPQLTSMLPPQQEIFAAAGPQQAGDPQAAARLGIRLDDRVQDAAVVADVAAGSPAERAGVRAGDAIVGLNQQRVGSPNDFLALASQIPPGSPAQLAISRTMNVDLVAGQTTTAGPIVQPAPAVVTPVQPVQPVAPRAAGRRFFRYR